MERGKAHYLLFQRYNLIKFTILKYKVIQGDGISVITEPRRLRQDDQWLKGSRTVQQDEASKTDKYKQSRTLKHQKIKQN